MKRTLSLLLSLVMMLSAVTATSFTASAEEIYTASVTVQYRQSDARTILDMINEMRTSSDAWYWNSDNKTKTVCTDLNELVYDYSLERAAMQRAAEIALSFSHTRPDGSRCFSAVSDEGISYYMIGENISAGYSTAAAANNGWREDDCDYYGQGHRRNMLMDSFNSVGIAGVTVNGTTYWVEEFAYIPTPDVTPTAANNKSTTATVKISSDSITSAELNTPSTISLDISETYNLATPVCAIELTDFWGRYLPVVSADVTYDVKDNEVIEFNDGVIKPLKLGTASITVSSLGTSKTINVNVICNHNYTVVSKTAAGCKTDGSISYKCDKCGGEKTDIIKGSHKYVTTPATLSKNGSVKCSVCGDLKSTIAYPKTISLSATSFVYDGKVKAPTVTVKDSKGKTLKKGTDYTVAYASGRKTVGKYAVKITFKGNYSGTKTLYFTIVPKGTTIASVTPASKSFTVKWRKQATQTAGYQIQYSTDASFKKNNNTVTISKNSTTSKKIAKLAGKKKYYVRVRTYRKVGSATYYSAWSAKSAVTTKK